MNSYLLFYQSFKSQNQNCQMFGSKNKELSIENEQLQKSIEDLNLTITTLQYELLS